MRSTESTLKNQSLTAQLTQYVFEKEICPQDLHRASLHVLDWVGCSAMGIKSDVGKKLGAMISNEQQHPNGYCSVLFSRQAHWQEALMVNGAVGNVLEMDDVHRASILHPGPVIIPAALAVAEKEKLSMKAFLSAIIRGYEVTIRIGQSIGRSHYQYFHNTSSIATVGAAVAAASLLSLSRSEVVDAMGNALSRTGGLWQMRNEVVDTKQFHNAEAARTGVDAARLAQAGITGPNFIIEGPQGLFNAMSTDADTSSVMKEQSAWMMYDCSFKPWPACRHAHPAIDVFKGLIERDELVLSNIEHVQIFTYQDAITFCDRLTPETSLQAKFSIQHSIALLLDGRALSLAQYQVDKLDSERLTELRSKVSIHLDATVESNYPQHFGARIELVTYDGKRYKHEIVDTLGDPECPLSDQQLAFKARTLLAQAGISEDKIDGLVDLSWSEQPHICALSTLLCNR